MAHLMKRIPQLFRRITFLRGPNNSTVTEATDGEQRLTKILRQKFPVATFLQVQDISGGCGAMYEIQLQTEEFRGKRTVMQHRMVNEALKEEIKDMHGLRISTAVPDETGS